MEKIVVKLQIHSDCCVANHSDWWQSFRRALKPDGRPADHWYAFYGGTDGSGNAVVVDRKTTEIVVELDETTAEKYEVLNVIAGRWRSISSPEMPTFKGPKSGLIARWTNPTLTRGHRSVALFDDPNDSRDLVDLDFGLLVGFDGDDPFVCDPTVKNRWK